MEFHIEGPTYLVAMATKYVETGRDIFVNCNLVDTRW
jgi:hypothetical protein